MTPEGGLRIELADRTLLSFLDAAASTSAELVAGSTPGFALVQQVDEFMRREVWAQELALGPIPATLALSSYYSFLGAVRIALGGHLTATFPLVRHGLESACYAYVMARDSRLETVWLERLHGPAEKMACRKEFAGSIKRAAQSIRLTQQQLGDLVSDLYETSIDFGAHPNVRSVVPHLSMTEADDQVSVGVPCLFGPSDIRTQQALIACAETGIAITFVTALAADDHPLVRDGFKTLDTMYRRVHEAMGDIQR